MTHSKSIDIVCSSTNDEEIKINEFVEYVMSFYGLDEIYDMKVTRAEVKASAGVRLGICKWSGIPFEGDSIDREAVRDIICDMREGLAA